MNFKLLNRFTHKNGIIINTCVQAREWQILHATFADIQHTSFKLYNNDVTKLNIEEEKYDFIGLPDKVSNIRPYILQEKENESPLEKILRENRTYVYKWNQEFWFKHNQQFYKERAEFIENGKANSTISSMMTADEMSQFYKAFLDKNWRTHLDYNIQWYKKNVALLVLSFRVHLENIFK